MTPKRLIVGISGATGIVYGVRLLECLRVAGIETHLVVSSAGKITCACEADISPSSLGGLADFSYRIGEVGAAIASGSFKTLGMIIAPCSMRTLAEVATGVSGSLLTRAADVCLKERRRLVLLTRETPLHAVHLRNMLAVTEMGGIICPPVPAFYADPHSIEDIIDQTVGRLLDLFDIESSLVHRWGEENAIKVMDDPVAAPRTERAKVS
jgi:flavin prenyltransferase